MAVGVAMWGSSQRNQGSSKEARMAAAMKKWRQRGSGEEDRLMGPGLFL